MCCTAGYFTLELWNQLSAVSWVKDSLNTPYSATSAAVRHAHVPNHPESTVCLSLSFFLTRIGHIYTTCPPESDLGRSQSHPSEGADWVGDGVGTQVGKAALALNVTHPQRRIVCSGIQTCRVLCRWTRVLALPRSEEELMNVKP